MTEMEGWALWHHQPGPPPCRKCFRAGEKRVSWQLPPLWLTTSGFKNIYGLISISHLQSSLFDHLNGTERAFMSALHHRIYGKESQQVFDVLFSWILGTIRASIKCVYTSTEKYSVGTGVSGKFSITYIKGSVLEEIDSNLRFKSQGRREEEGSEKEDNVVDCTENVYLRTQNMGPRKEKGLTSRKSIAGWRPVLGAGPQHRQ